MERFIETAISSQAQRGGDRKIGRKLSGLLWENHFTDTMNQIVTINTEMMDGNDFLNITTSFKLELIPDDDLHWAKACISKARKAIESGSYFGQAGVYIVSANRPK